MSVLFAVFNYEEPLNDPELVDGDVYQYVGAIPEYSGAMLNGRCCWMTVQRGDAKGYLFALEDAKLGDDMMHVILHDAKNDVTFLQEHEAKLTEILKICAYYAQPTTPGESRTEMMTRSDSDERVNLVMSWKCDVARVIEWVFENHGGSVTHDK